MFITRFFLGSPLVISLVFTKSKHVPFNFLSQREAQMNIGFGISSFQKYYVSGKYKGWLVRRHVAPPWRHMVTPVPHFRQMADTLPTHEQLPGPPATSRRAAGRPRGATWRPRGATWSPHWQMSDRWPTHCPHMGHNRGPRLPRAGPRGAPGAPHAATSRRRGGGRRIFPPDLLGVTGQIQFILHCICPKDGSESIFSPAALRAAGNAVNG